MAIPHYLLAIQQWDLIAITISVLAQTAVVIICIAMTAKVITMMIKCVIWKLEVLVRNKVIAL